jgi:hypothetical protein
VTDHACAGDACRLCDARGVPKGEREGYVVPVPADLKRIPDVAGQTLARRSDPASSKAAAALLGSAAGTQRAVLLRAFGNHPLTAEEAARESGLLQTDHRGNFTKRVSDLFNLGLIAPTGEHRPGTSGRMAQVLAITTEGRRHL